MGRVGEIFLRGSLFSAVVGCAGVLVGFAGQNLHWSFDLAAQFLLPAIIVSCVAALAAGIARLPLLAAGSLAIALLATLVSVPWTLGPDPAPKEAAKFSVLLFNVWYGNQRLIEVAQLVQRENPDVVVFVEATPRVRNELQSLSAIYPYRLDCIGSRGCDVLIFSRFRLSPNNVAATQDPEHSPLLSLTTDIAGCRMMLFATHMTRPFPNRPFWAQRAQAREIGSEVASHDGAKLVLGDFNAAPWGYVMRTIILRGGVQILTGAGGTWPSVLPKQLRIPIDHILAGPGLSFVSRRVLAPFGSDHAPVLAEIAITDRTKCR